MEIAWMLADAVTAVASECSQRLQYCRTVGPRRLAQILALAQFSHCAAGSPRVNTFFYK